MKTKVAMLFGGKSVEHEVSVISGIQALLNMDTEKYEVIPVYMTKQNVYPLPISLYLSLYCYSISSSPGKSSFFSQVQSKSLKLYF